MKFSFRTFNKQKGFGLVETIISVGLFSIIAFSAYFGFFELLKVLNVLKIKSLSANLANEQMEIIKSLSYGDVDYTPGGKINNSQNFIREGFNFSVNTNINLFNDSNLPAVIDYKKIEMKIQCIDCGYDDEMKYYTAISPKTEIELNNP